MKTRFKKQPASEFAPVSDCLRERDQVEQALKAHQSRCRACRDRLTCNIGSKLRHDLFVVQQNVRSVKATGRPWSVVEGFGLPRRRRTRPAR